MSAHWEQNIEEHSMATKYIEKKCIEDHAARWASSLANGVCLIVNTGCRQYSLL